MKASMFCGRKWRVLNRVFSGLSSCNHSLKSNIFLAGFFSTSQKKLKDEKTQNSSTKLNVVANLVLINAENKANKSKNEEQFRLKLQIHGCKYEL